MNRNTSYAASTSSQIPPLRPAVHSSAATVQITTETESDAQPTGGLEQQYFSPLLGMASLSLAFSANAPVRFAASQGVLSSSHVTSVKVGTARKVTNVLPSQVRCNAPIPVMSGASAISQISLTPPTSLRAPELTLGHATAFPDLVRLSGSNGYRYGPPA